MRNEKKSGNTSILKEGVMVCLLLLFFFILIMIGRLIVDKVNNERTIENGQGPTNFDNVSFEQHISGEEIKEIEGIDTLEDYKLVTETLRISDFKLSEKEDRVDITGSIENLTNDKIKNVRIRTKLYDENYGLIQEISTSISEIDAKSIRTYSFSKFSNYKEIKKIKVELMKDEILQDESLIDIHQ